MEGFKPNQHKENQKSLEFKKTFEKASTKIRFALKVLFVSALSILPKESSAQNNENYNRNIETKSQIEWQTNLNEKEKHKVEKEIQEQKKWLEEYINSQKFTERLTKEYMLLKEMGGENAIPNLDSFIENKIFLKYIVNKKGDTVAVINPLTEGLELKNDYELSINEFNKIIEENNTLDKLVPVQNINKAPIAVINKVKLEKQRRLENINNGPIIIVDSIENTDSGGKVFGVSFNKEEKKILLIKDFKEEGGTTPVHELTHRSTDGVDKINDATFFLLKNKANSGSNYLDNPTEIHARINELRYLMDKEGLYNAKKSDFTKYHYDYLINNEEIMKNFTMKQLLQTLDEEDLIWFMNNLADTNVSTVDITNIA